MKKKRVFLLSGILVFFLPLFPQTVSQIEVRFTSPENSSAAVKEYITGVLGGAQKSVYAAVYDLNCDDVAQTLISLKKRGVDVRLVTDDTNMRRPSIEKLWQNGIGVIDDKEGKNGLMHNKFIIVDSRLVITGSLNFTERGFQKNNNNVILLNSSACADIYTGEFFEMFRDKNFKNRKDRNRKTAEDYYVKLGEVPLNIYFSPENDIERILCGRIGKAKKSVTFLAFSYTSEKIADEMIALSKKGIIVAGVFEKKGASSKHSQYSRLKSEGLSVRLDKNPYNMHHKVIIIDGETVVTGSYNFTQNASRTNDENLLIVTDAAVAAKYTSEFEHIYQTAAE